MIDGFSTARKQKQGHPRGKKAHYRQHENPALLPVCAARGSRYERSGA
jgi:hypothetical protein